MWHDTKLFVVICDHRKKTLQIACTVTTRVKRMRNALPKPKGKRKLNDEITVIPNIMRYSSLKQSV